MAKRRSYELFIVVPLLIALACGGEAEGDGAQVPGATASSEATIEAPSPATPEARYAPEGEQPFQGESFRPGSRFGALDFPAVLGADESTYFSDDELVLGLALDGEAHAYPLRMARYHHVINDSLGGIVCSSGVGFDSTAQDEELLFSPFGIYNGVLVMADRATQSVWTHLEGRSVQGTLAGEQLEILPLLHTTLGEWKQLHPETTILDPDTPFAAQYTRPVTIGPARPGSARLGPARPGIRDVVTAY